MNQKRATELLLSGGKLTNRVRKHCMKAREISMVSQTPIYKEETEGEPTEYFSSKPSEMSNEQRLSAKLRRATLVQLHKWALRNAVRQSACLGVAERIAAEAATSALRRREKFIALAMRHGVLCDACTAEIDRRKEEIAMRAELKAEHV